MCVRPAHAARRKTVHLASCRTRRPAVVREVAFVLA